MRTTGVAICGAACLGAALCAAALDDTIALGRKALLNEGVATAWKLAQRALAEAPESPVAHEFAGEVLFRRSEFKPAEARFNEAVKLDPKLARGYWGLARLAEIQSLNKTAAALFRRAHDLDPADPPLFRDWAMRLEGSQHIQGLEKYLAMNDPSRTPDDVQGLRDHIDMDKALDGRRVMNLASPYEAARIPMILLMNDPMHMRAYGLEVEVNGHKLRLLLDTGASGILIQRDAAESAGVARLAGARFGGIGDDRKLPGGYHGIAESVRIGSVEFSNALISVSDKDLVGVGDGLIGTNVFAPFLVTLDFPARTLRLAPLKGYDLKSQEPLDRVVSPEMRAFTPVFRFGHMLFVPTRVNDSREALFGIDSGAARTLLSYDIAAEATKMRADDKLRLNGVSGQVRDVYQTADLFLQFAGFRQKSAGMTAFDMREQSRRMGTEVSGLLGLPLLNMFALTIDYRDGLVNFDYKGP